MAPSNFPQYNKDEKVLCFHHELLYEAKVLDYKHAIEGDKKSPYQYRVHYKGWKNTYVNSSIWLLLSLFQLWSNSPLLSKHVNCYCQPLVEDGNQPPLCCNIDSIVPAFLSLLPTAYTLALLHSQDPVPKHFSSSRYLPFQLSLFQQPSLLRSTFCRSSPPEQAI